MKKYYLLIAFIFAAKAIFSQTIPSTGCEIVYSYDGAGNRTQRAYYCNGGPTERTSNKTAIRKDSIQREGPSAARVEALYPNPTDGKFTVLFSYDLDKADVFLHDITGKTVQHFKASGSRLDFDISRLSAGTYLLSIIINGTAVLNEKVIKVN